VQDPLDLHVKADADQKRVPLHQIPDASSHLNVLGLRRGDVNGGTNEVRQCCRGGTDHLIHDLTDGTEVNLRQLDVIFIDAAITAHHDIGDHGRVHVSQNQKIFAFQPVPIPNAHGQEGAAIRRQRIFGFEHLHLRRCDDDAVAQNGRHRRRGGSHADISDFSDGIDFIRG